MFLFSRFVNRLVNNLSAKVLIEQLPLAAVAIPPRHIFVNVENVFFVKVACNSSNMCRENRIGESAAGSSPRFGAYHVVCWSSGY